MTKLKPCPFCGGKAKWDKDWQSISCTKCRARIYAHRTYSDAVESWNNRPSPWHTGTPTEEGDYYIAFRNFIGADVEYGWASWDGEGWDINFLGWHFSNEILAWQKIEPYKEKENGK